MLRILGVFVLAVAVAGVARPAAAEDTIALYADFGAGTGSSRAVILKPGEPFDIVAVTNTSSTGRHIEFGMTELSTVYSGVFKVSTTRYGGSTVALGNEDLGEQVFALYGCMPAGTNEVVRIRYHDVNGSLPDNVVLSLNGLQPRDLFAPHFPGEMGYIDCTEVDHLLAPAPWDESTGMDPSRIDGVSSTDGILVLNPNGLSVPTRDGTMSTLKARY